MHPKSKKMSLKSVSVVVYSRKAGLYIIGQKLSHATHNHWTDANRVECFASCVIKKGHSSAIDDFEIFMIIVSESSLNTTSATKCVQNLSNI